MKLLVFAHTPPPHHGQSYMIQLMLNGFGGDQRKAARSAAAAQNPYGLECYHVNARVSKRMDDIGGLRPGKVLLLLGYCFQAIWCRYRYGVTTMYYVPAPGKRSALYRDWMVMALCRPFFKKVILHWHAAGLGNWLETHVQMRARTMTFRRMGAVDLSIVLSDYSKGDASKFLPKAITLVNNGIPDPCPDFDRAILPRRSARLAARLKLADGGKLAAGDLAGTGGDPQMLRILYVAHCTRDKGLFDSVHGVRLANEQLRATGSPFSLELVVIGQFMDPAERQEFDALVAQPELQKSIKFLGYVTTEAKFQAFAEADLFCFPSYYQNENQPANLIEAIAFGLPALTTRWRGIPEIFPRDYAYFVGVRAPDQVAAKLLQSLGAREPATLYRQKFLQNFVLEQHLRALADAIRTTEA